MSKHDQGPEGPQHDSADAADDHGSAGGDPQRAQEQVEPHDEGAGAEAASEQGPETRGAAGSGEPQEVARTSIKDRLAASGKADTADTDTGTATDTGADTGADTEATNEAVAPAGDRAADAADDEADAAPSPNAATGARETTEPETEPINIGAAPGEPPEEPATTDDSVDPEASAVVGSPADAATTGEIADPEATAVVGSPADAATPGDPVDPGATAVVGSDAATPGDPVDPEASAAVGPDAGATRDADAEATAVVGPPAASADEVDDTPAATATEEQDATVTPKKKSKRKKSRLAKAGIWIGVIVLVLGGVYLGSAWFLGDRVPADTTVAGVDVSGLSVQDAEDVLEDELGSLAEEPLPLSFHEVGAELDPESVGMSFDAEATVAQFTGFTLNPQILLAHIFGLGDQDPVTYADTEALEAALESLAQDLDISPVEGSITLVEAEAEVSEPEDGLAVDVDESVALLEAEWLTGPRPVELPSQVVEPEIGPAQIDAAMTEIIDPFLSGPVTVVAGDAEVEVTTAELTAAATLETDGPDFILDLDGQELAEVITDKEDSIGETPSDAQIELDGGEPTIIPAVTGTGLDPAEVGPALHEASLQTDPDERVASLELTETEAEFTTEDAEALGVVEVIGRYSTPMPYDPPRTENLQIGTSRINNTLIMPGENFSLLAALSPISVAGGYNSSGVVVDGFATEAAGGGLSQLSTTVFNAAFEAGLEDVTHQPHSRWFQRYPEGREATLFSPDLDLIFGNNTDYGVLIQSWVGDGQTHVVLWGTDVWDVNITTGNRYNITQPQTVYNEGPNCTPESGGQTGFTVQYTRTVSAGGDVAEQRTYTHTYRPWNRVVCGAPGSDDDSGSEDNGDDDNDDDD